ncbi:polyprenyl synthetase family protein [Mangrovivirga cuniculi]|uniref:Polyprenyl synthetase family protein n=1 Tax=Mangrovivirga cuniculi TaxID=2715131 RepID=A0A4D7JUC2_9BACT|nr:polyprenyl synthetase family protein [Mangrovivirga cuniculi]QCK15776.1 polyprenyl synthetase family protein [Mangrovivirga cuniculi]
METSVLKSKLQSYRELALKGINHYVPKSEPRKHLYDLVMDYPSRGGKGFRPGLCISTCKAWGGNEETAINSATALELFHNAFLVHDDIEDGSEFRRNKPTMHEYNNIGIAINVGDAMNVLSIKPLMMNINILGPELTWQIFSEIEHMVRQSVEGQAMELGWRKENSKCLTEDDYLRMILKKTCWYTTIHPIRIGAIIGSKGKVNPDMFNRFGFFMGTAFQIQDDVLNLIADEKAYGKEIGGDILEGKRTLMLIDLIQKLKGSNKSKLINYLANCRNENQLDNASWVLDKMHEHGCIEYARKVSKHMAGAALKEFYTCFQNVEDSEDKDMIEALIMHMISRDY